MSKLTRGLQVSQFEQRDTEALGDATDQFSKNDINKAVVYNAEVMDLAAAGNDIVGFIETVEAFTVNGLHSCGTVKKSGRFIVEVGVGEVGNLAVNDLIVADTQIALNTAAKAMVKSGAPAVYKWAVMWLNGGDGSAGTTVTVERV